MPEAPPRSWRVLRKYGKNRFVALVTIDSEALVKNPLRLIYIYNLELDALELDLFGASVFCRITPANGYGERDAAKAMAADLAGAHQKTVGADKNYDTKGFVAEMRRIGVTPHVAQNAARPDGSTIDGHTSRHEGYAQSINARRGIEKVFGWIKAFGGLRQFKVRGTENVSAVFGLHMIAYNLIRLGNLLKPAMVTA